MINSIKLTNFKRHRDLTLTFGAGMTALRGSNEAGKSTVCHAIAYALFGVKAIPNSLEDTVTHGSPVGTLRVDLSITLDNVEYTIRRSKSGCECNYAGGVVTGQTEVSNFISMVLRVDAASAARLMVSPQSEIRGALEAGPKATTEMIERLSDFNQIDELIELLQEKLTLGNTAAATARVAMAQTRLEEARLIEKPDFATLESAVTAARAHESMAEKGAEVAVAAHAKAQQRHAEAKAKAAALRSLEVRRTNAIRDAAKADADLAALKAASVDAPADADNQIQVWVEAKASIGAVREARRVYEEFEKLPKVARFAGNLEAALAVVREDIDTLRKRQGDLNGKVHMLKAKLSLGTCSFCGQDFSEVPEVKARNEAVQDELDEIDKVQTTLAQHFVRLTQDKDDLLELQIGGKPILAFSARYPQHLVIDARVYPPALTWNGPVPQDISVIPDYDAQISATRAQVKAAERYQREVEAKTASAKIASRELEAIEKQSSDFGATESEAISGANLEVAVHEMDLARNVWRSTQQTLALREREDNEARRQWAWAEKEVHGTQIELNAAQDALKDLEFNNALLKRVRAARPIISDRLWSIVLKAVGSYFSDIRGVKSRVTKDVSGFLVDEHPVSTLSGSTLDALGLAIRVALVRTFLPAASFLLLDEPMAAMDDDRTGNMLGFLSRCGYDQVILITHESVSETVADHVIELEG